MQALDVPSTVVLVACREKLNGRIAKLEAQLAQQTERADLAERQLAAANEQADAELRRARLEAERQLAAAHQAAAQARAATEQQSARCVVGQGQDWPCNTGLTFLKSRARDASLQCTIPLPSLVQSICSCLIACPRLRCLCRESAEALSAAIEREAELRAALAEANNRFEAAAAGG